MERQGAAGAQVEAQGGRGLHLGRARIDAGGGDPRGSGLLVEQPRHGLEELLVAAAGGFDRLPCRCSEAGACMRNVESKLDARPPAKAVRDADADAGTALRAGRGPG
jgi:hypothetical protein